MYIDSSPLFSLPSYSLPPSLSPVPQVTLHPPPPHMAPQLAPHLVTVGVVPIPHIMTGDRNPLYQDCVVSVTWVTPAS